MEKKLFFRTKKNSTYEAHIRILGTGHGKEEKKLINRNKFNRVGIMVHLTTSYNGLISMVEMKEKFDSKFFCKLMGREYSPNTTIFT